MTASSKIKEGPPAAQVGPAKKVAKLKADNEAKKAKPLGLRQQTPTSPIEMPLAPEPERISAAYQSQGPPPPPMWLPDSLVAKRYQINPRTLRRWDEDSSLGFPPVIIINSRRYRELAALEAWERQTAARARSAKAKRIEEHSAVGAA